MIGHTVPPKTRRPLDPDQALRQAVLLGRQGRTHEAEAQCRKILAAAPGHFSTLRILTEMCLRAGRLAEAVAFARKALNQRPSSTDALLNLGVALEASGRNDEAAERYRKALVLDPRHVGVLSNLGLVLARQDRMAEAVAHFERALAIAPDFAPALVNLGTAEHALGRFEAAVACFERAISLGPGQARSENNLGNTLLALRRPEQAIEHFMRAQALAPNYAAAHHNEATARLAAGDFTAGWQKYEWRWAVPEFQLRRRKAAEPVWLGTLDIAGKTILLDAEQGYGDTIQFARYAPLVAERGARVIMAVPTPLVALMTGLDGVAEAHDQNEAPPAFDFHCPLISLPLAFATTLETIPNRVPYLSADPAQAAAWRRRLAALPGPRVGLVWAGGHSTVTALHRIDRRRSVALADLVPLAEVLGVNFVSLQLGPPALETAAPPPGLTVHDWTTEIHDFADTAALIAELDLVISVDTSVVHLAGALGKPTWLLNRYDSCWRWLIGRDDSPWYPTLRQFRQKEPGDWNSVIAAVRIALEPFVHSTGGR